MFSDSKPKFFDTVTQIALPTFTIGAQLLVSLKMPEWGLVVNMLGQPFWWYSAWKAYRNAGQIGLFITTVIMSLIIGLGIVNYWWNI